MSALPPDLPRLRTLVTYLRGELGRAEQADIERAVSALIEAGAAAGEFQVSEVRTAARAVTSLGIDVSRRYTDRSTETPEELGRRYGELMLPMLGARV